MTLSIRITSVRISFQKIRSSSVSFNSVPQPFKGVVISRWVSFCVALHEEYLKCSRATSKNGNVFFSKATVIMSLQLTDTPGSKMKLTSNSLKFSRILMCPNYSCLINNNFELVKSQKSTTHPQCFPAFHPNERTHVYILDRRDNKINS